ncbi:MAG: twin-arginine translocation signal domain-containing protein, partial [Planctomycetaceae bacterium]|nr:twin-arginine translocation signal domain-containing protein [Planctomycetaceae bacterium]
MAAKNASSTSRRQFLGGSMAAATALSLASTWNPVSAA